MTRAAFSPGGSRILTSGGNTVRIWNADGTGEPRVLRGHDAYIYSSEFSRDGARIVTTSADRTVRVWNVDGAAEPIILRGHQAEVYSAAFSPDGRRIVSVSTDKSIRIWNADGLGQPMVLLAPDFEALSAAFSPDGTRIVTTSHAGHTAWIWTDIEPFTGLDDPRLWKATRYCPSVERRMELLGVSRATARKNLEACRRRVEAHAGQ